MSQCKCSSFDKKDSTSAQSGLPFTDMSSMGENRAKNSTLLRDRREYGNTRWSQYTLGTDPSGGSELEQQCLEGSNEPGSSKNFLGLFFIWFRSRFRKVICMRVL